MVLAGPSGGFDRAGPFRRPPRPSRGRSANSPALRSDRLALGTCSPAAHDAASSSAAALTSDETLLPARPRRSLSSLARYGALPPRSHRRSLSACTTGGGTDARSLRGWKSATACGLRSRFWRGQPRPCAPLWCCRVPYAVALVRSTTSRWTGLGRVRAGTVALPQRSDRPAAGQRQVTAGSGSTSTAARYRAARPATWPPARTARRQCGSRLWPGPRGLE